MIWNSLSLIKMPPKTNPKSKKKGASITSGIEIETNKRSENDIESDNSSEFEMLPNKKPKLDKSEFN